MQGTAHKRTTFCALELIFKDEIDIQKYREIVDASPYPDSIDDIEANGIVINGFDVWGHKFTSFQHYCIPNSSNPKTKFRGYNFALDKSWKGLNLRDFSIKFHERKWFKEFDGSAIDGWLKKHPMKILLDNKEYTNKSFDEITYCSSASVAEFLESGLPLGFGEKFNNKIVGSILHMAQDAWMRPHSKGYVLDGHVDYETRITPLVDIVFEETKLSIPNRKWKGCRSEVERSAYYSSLTGKDIASMKACVKGAIESSAFIIKNLLVI